MFNPSTTWLGLVRLAVEPDGLSEPPKHPAIREGSNNDMNKRHECEFNMGVSPGQLS